MADPVIKVDSTRGLLARKLVVAFALGFLAYLLPAVLSLIDDIESGKDIAFGTTLIVSLVVGAFGAGLRALLALSPLNVAGPTDALHTLGSTKPKAVTVADSGVTGSTSIGATANTAASSVSINP